MMETKKKSKWWRWGLCILLSPFLLFFIIGILIYIPPVQQFIVDKVAASLSEETGVEVSIGKVRLAFPLDLAIHDVVAKDKEDELAKMRALRLQVRLYPLFKGIVDVDGFEVYDAEVNTKSWVPDLYLRGRIHKFTAATHGINLGEEKVNLDFVTLDGAHLFVALGDSTVSEPSEPSKWNILAEKVELTNADLCLSLPGDSMRIGFQAHSARLKGGQIDLGQSNYHIGNLNLRSGGLTYAFRSLQADSLYSDSLCLMTDSAFWVSDSLSLVDSLHTLVPPVQEIAFSSSDSLLWEGFVPQSEGIDPNLIVLNKLDFELGNINYLNDGQMSVSVRDFFLKERSGAQIDHLEGGIVLSKGKLCLSDFALKTPTSHLRAQSEVWLDSILGGKDDYGRLVVEGEVSAADVRTLANGFVKESILNRWPESPLKMDIDVDGTSRTLNVAKFQVDWPCIARVQVQGEVLHPFSSHRIGKMDVDLRTYGLAFFHSLMESEGNLALKIPEGFALWGRVDVNGDNYSWDTKVYGGEGKIDCNGKLNLKQESYQAQMVSSHFPLQSFLPGVSIGPISATIEASGCGLDFFNKSTTLQAQVSLDTLRYENWQLGRVDLSANYAQGKGEIGMVSDNDLLDGEGKLNVSLDDMIELSLNTDLYDLNLSKLLSMKETLSFGSSLLLDVYANKDLSAYGFGGSLTNIRFVTKDRGIQARDLYYSFDSTVDTTLVSISSGDMDLNLSASGNVDKITKDLNGLLTVLEEQAIAKKLDQTALKVVAPTLRFSMTTGAVNPLVNLFREMGYEYDGIALDLSMSPELGVQGEMNVSNFSTGKVVLDTVKVGLMQDTTGLVADAWIKNFKKRNKNKFEANIKTYLLDSGAGAELMIRNHDGVEGMNFGVLANVDEKGVKMHLYPEHPVLAFRHFTVNKDNYFFLGKDSTLSADINMLASDGTGLRVYTQPADSLNDLTFSLNNLNLSAFSGLFPYVPDLEGIFNGDLHIIDNHQTISAMSAVTVDKFVLDGAPLGDIGAEIIYLPQDSTKHYANIYVSSNDTEILALDGLYSIDKEKENFEGNAQLLDFPLELLNGFLVGTDLAMRGKANGSLNVKGDMSNPDLNGELIFNKAHLFSEVYGFDFQMDESPVRIVDNQMVVKDYALSSHQSKNPLFLNGTLDMRDLSNVKMDFSMRARNFELINAKKQEKSLVYGKVYADFDGTMKGAMDDMYIRGKLSILDRTDMTYILKDSPLTVDDRLHDLVQFVDFEETYFDEEVAIEPSSNFDMTLGISINDAALFHCNLSEDGSNYVDLEGGGDLTLRLTQQGDMRLTGRFTATSGEMKYSLPVIPLKTFKLVRGSYVDFTGDALNPTLSIAAKERMKAMITENDQPRSVAFDVGVSITQPLDRMGLEFTIEAPEDLTIQNQLATMTKAERGKVAVAMLATGMYLTEESLSSSTSGFKASNALTSFLQSEIQNIAGSALKTIDITIGMENNTTATGATTTDYSFQFAKRFWGNRISVIVGGKVSTGAEAENSAESFIDNVAVEYRLDKTASRYVRVFYERSFQDPLEGQLTKTGAGLVLRRKSDKLGDLFIFRNRDPKKKITKSTKEKNR